MIELVNHKNINPNVICAQGSTALHGILSALSRIIIIVVVDWHDINVLAACFGGHPEAVAILLMSGAHSLEIVLMLHSLTC